MNICPNCNKKNSDDAIFCNYCGQQLTDSTVLEDSIPESQEQDTSSTESENSKLDPTKEGASSSKDGSSDIEAKNDSSSKKKKNKKIISIVLVIALSVLTVIGLKLFAIIRTELALKNGIEYSPIKIIYEKEPLVSKNTNQPKFGVIYLEPVLKDDRFTILTYNPSNKSIYSEMKFDLISEAMEKGIINASSSYVWRSPYEYYNYFTEDKKDIDWEWIASKKRWSNYSSRIEKIKYKWAWNWKDFEVLLANGITMTLESPFYTLPMDQFWEQYTEDELALTGIGEFDKPIVPEIPKDAIGFFFPPAVPRYIWMGLEKYNEFWYQNFYETIDEAISSGKSYDAPGLWYWDYVFRYGYLDHKITKNSKGNDIYDSEFDYWHVVIPSYGGDEEFVFKCKKDEPFSSDYLNELSIPINKLETALPFYLKESVIPGARTRIIGLVPEISGTSEYYLSNGKTLSIYDYQTMQKLTAIKNDSLRIKIAESILDKKHGDISIEGNTIWVHQDYDYQDTFHLYCGYLAQQPLLRGYFNLPEEYIKEDTRINSITLVSGFDEIQIANGIIYQHNSSFTIGDHFYKSYYADFYLSDNFKKLESMIETGDLSLRMDIDGKLESFVVSEENLQNMKEIINLYKDFDNF